MNLKSGTTITVNCLIGEISSVYDPDVQTPYSGTLKAWRIVEGEVSTVPLYWTAYPYKGYKLSDIKEWSIVQVEAEYGVYSGQKSITVKNILKTAVEDDELWAHKNTPKNTVLCEHEKLGTLAIDPTDEDSCFKGVISWCGREIKIFLPVDHENSIPIPEAAEALVFLLKNQKKYDNLLRQAATELCLHGYLDSLEFSDHHDMSKARKTVAKKVFVKSIHTGTDQLKEFRAIISDNGYCGGHEIWVSGHTDEMKLDEFETDMVG